MKKKGKLKPEQPKEVFPKPRKLELLQTKVYCPFLPDMGVMDAKKMYPYDYKKPFKSRNEAVPLNLRVEDLPGTIWINIYTGGLAECGLIGWDNFGYPGPSHLGRFADLLNFEVLVLFSVGLWWSPDYKAEPRFEYLVVDNYVWLANPSDHRISRLRYEQEVAATYVEPPKKQKKETAPKKEAIPSGQLKLF